jgi:hypothetical protein
MKRFFLVTLLFSHVLLADKVVIPKRQVDVDNPWYTGPLLCPSSVVVPAGHVNFEPYVYISAGTGSYDKQGKVVKNAHTFWSNSFQPVVQVGLTSWMDIQFLPLLVYNYHDHQAKCLFYDFPVTIDFQILAPNHIGDWTPYLKLFISESFPTGKFRHLNPNKLGVDISGTGSFRTSTGFVIGELFHFKRSHFLIARLLLQYEVCSAAHLKGFNCFGGYSNTNARLFPGQNVEADLGLEYTLSQNWVLACDFVGAWSASNHYSGDPGTLPSGAKAVLQTGSSNQYSLAPAIEYNWNANLGVIGGCWFTVAGNNAPRFWTGTFALNYYY